LKFNVSLIENIGREYNVEQKLIALNINWWTHWSLVGCSGSCFDL